MHKTVSFQVTLPKTRALMIFRIIIVAAFCLVECPLLAQEKDSLKSNSSLLI